MIRFIIFSATFLFFISGIISQESNTVSSTSTTNTHYSTEKFDGYNKNEPHCFRFTWLGPGYDNKSEVEGTCNDLSDKYKLKNTPCKQPLVITDNGGTPNMTELYLMYPDYVLCRRSKGQVCLKYSYIYNGKYDNITYMCGKASTEGEGAETSGCYSEYRNGYEIQVCICESRAGVMPCNSAKTHKMAAEGLFALIIGFLFQVIFTRW